MSKRPATSVSMDACCPMPIEARRPFWATCDRPSSSVWTAPGRTFALRLLADWNDCIRLGPGANPSSSRFTALCAGRVRASLPDAGPARRGAWGAGTTGRLDSRLKAVLGRRLVRAGLRRGWIQVRMQGERRGTIFLIRNPGPCSAGIVTRAAARAMQSVEERLSTEFGLMLCDPPFVKTDFKVNARRIVQSGNEGELRHFPPHSGWAVMARHCSGTAIWPIAISRPICPALTTRGPKSGRSSLTFTASSPTVSTARGRSFAPSLVKRSATLVLLRATPIHSGRAAGIRGSTHRPCISSAWKGFKVTRVFRGKLLTIEVTNPAGVEKGVRSCCSTGAS